LTYVVYHINVHFSIKPFFISIPTFHFINFSKILIFALRFKALSIFTKWKYTFLKRFHVYKMAKTRFPSGFVSQNEKTSFRSVFHVYKRNHDLIWSDFMLMKWKTRSWSVFHHVYNIKKTSFWSAFSCLQNKITFLKRFHVYKMIKLVFEAIFISTKWKNMFWRVLSTKC